MRRLMVARAMLCGERKMDRGFCTWPITSKDEDIAAASGVLTATLYQQAMAMTGNDYPLLTIVTTVVSDGDDCMFLKALKLDYGESLWREIISAWGKGSV